MIYEHLGPVTRKQSLVVEAIGGGDMESNHEFNNLNKTYLRKKWINNSLTVKTLKKYSFCNCTYFMFLKYYISNIYFFNRVYAV